MERITRRRYVMLGLALFAAFIVLTLFNNPAMYSSKLSNIANIGDDSIDTTTDTIANNKEETTINDIGLDQPEDEPVKVLSEPTKAENWTPKQFTAPSKHVMDMVNTNVMTNSKDKVLLCAVVNNGMADYTMNWIESLKKSNVDKKFLVFAIDQALVDTLTEAGYGKHVVLIPTEWFHKEISAEFAGWLEGDYTPITHAKSLVVERLLYLGITVWFSDVDIVFTNAQIFPYLMLKLKSRKHAITKQELTEVLFSQELEQRLINSGFFIMRPTETSKRIMSDTISIQDKETKVTQQQAMNRILDDINLSYHESPIALLDLTLFPHGRYYFDNNVPARFSMTPMIVHANYRQGQQKKADLQKAGLWYLKE